MYCLWVPRVVFPKRPPFFFLSSSKPSMDGSVSDGGCKGSVQSPLKGTQPCPVRTLTLEQSSLAGAAYIPQTACGPTSDQDRRRKMCVCLYVCVFQLKRFLASRVLLSASRRVFVLCVRACVCLSECVCRECGMFYRDVIAAG